MKLRIVLTVIVLLLGLTLISGSAPFAMPVKSAGYCVWPHPWSYAPYCPQTLNSICQCRPGEICYGSQYTDIILATQGDDEIHGKGGDDWICGYGGSDHIYGGQGDDHIYGGDGNDMLYGQFGADKLFGEDGNHDYCDGGWLGKDFLDSSCETRVNP